MENLVPVSDNLSIITEIDIPNIGSSRRGFSGGRPDPVGFMNMPGMGPGFGMNTPGRGMMQSSPGDINVVLAEWTFLSQNAVKKESLENTVELNPDWLDLIERLKERRRMELERE